MNKKYLLLFVGLFYTWTLAAQSVTVDASIDSLQILIGQQAKIKLEVTYDAGKIARLPVLRDTLVTGIEILDTSKPDTIYLNEKRRMQLTQTYTVTSFDSALYYIPPFEVLVDSIPYQSKSLALMVYSMWVDEENPEQFFGPKPIMRAPFSWDDWATAIWLSLLAIPLVILLVFLIVRFNESKLIVKRVKIEPKLPPHVEAMQHIERIKTDRVWQKGETKEYYTELTDVLRTYIQDRFGFNALEMTSSEIIDMLQGIEEKEALKELRELFMTADLVKFAKHNPLMNENDMNLVNAIEFVNQTKLEEPVNPKPEPKEVTIEEKRSRRSKVALLCCIILLLIVVIGILIYVGIEVYSSI